MCEIGTVSSKLFMFMFTFVKIQNCLDVVRNGVKGVCIIDGRLDHSILFELLSDKGSGTLIRQ